MVPIVTIDGPSGSGKGTISKSLALELGWNYLDSGLIYRCYAFLHLNKVSNIPDEIKKIQHNYSLEHESITYQGKDITGLIRGSEITKLSSELSQLEEVRSTLIKIQKTFRKPPGLIAEGRDMSSKLFPNSNLKIFLTADLHVRVKRRANQLAFSNKKVDIIKLRSSIEKRDQMDSQRKNSPLIKTPDSILIDNTSKSERETLEIIIDLVRKHCPTI
tara:strand:+ start:75 stop:725 length:651 start_codon:yes stop_codon:yes gene_type:complete